MTLNLSSSVTSSQSSDHSSRVYCIGAETVQLPVGQIELKYFRISVSIKIRRKRRIDLTGFAKHETLHSMMFTVSILPLNLIRPFQIYTYRTKPSRNTMTSITIVVKTPQEDKGWRRPSIQSSFTASKGSRLVESYFAISSSGRSSLNQRELGWYTWRFKSVLPLENVKMRPKSLQILF